MKDLQTFGPLFLSPELVTSRFRSVALGGVPRPRPFPCMNCALSIMPSMTTSPRFIASIALSAASGVEKRT